MNKKKILIVDDERNFAEMVKLVLESTDRYKVKIELDSSNALSAAYEYLPDLILLDVIMANAEGPDVAAALREDPVLKEIPIIFLTATVTQKEVDEEGGVIGGHPFVAKPSSLETLLDAIEKNMMTVWPPLHSFRK